MPANMREKKFLSILITILFPLSFLIFPLIFSLIFPHISFLVFLLSDFSHALSGLGVAPLFSLQKISFLKRKLHLYFCHTRIFMVILSVSVPLSICVSISRAKTSLLGGTPRAISNNVFPEASTTFIEKSFLRGRNQLPFRPRQSLV